MRSRAFSLAVLVFFSSAWADAQQVLQYAVTDLGTLGGTTSVPAAINSAGEVVGWSYTSSGAQHAFLYANGTMTDLGTLPGYPQSTATGINDLGQIVGNVSSSASDTELGFVYTGAVMAALGTLGGSSSSASGINDSGEVVGASTLPGNNVYHAFLFSAGTMTDLTPGLTTGYSLAACINQGGLAAGIVNNHAAVFSAGTTTVIDSSWSEGSEVYGMNANGEIVGNAISIDSPQDVFGFVYSNGTVTNLGTADAGGLNDYGQLVGAVAVPSNGIVYGALWQSASASPINLNGLISPSSHWNLGPAEGINNAGEIVGRGVNPEGQIDAYLLTPLEPGDANGDGRVDINDLTIVLANFGQSGCAWSQGCMDGDPAGAVDVDDLTIVLSNFGYGTTAGAGPAATREPCALVLLLAALACLLARRPRLRSGAAAQTSRSASGTYRPRWLPNHSN
jgi:probable HAF family extracellular repeat protein